jgi:hypothetical protein
MLETTMSFQISASGEHYSVTLVWHTNKFSYM